MVTGDYPTVTVGLENEAAITKFKVDNIEYGVYGYVTTNKNPTRENPIYVFADESKIRREFRITGVNTGTPDFDFIDHTDTKREKGTHDIKYNTQDRETWVDTFTPKDSKYNEQRVYGLNKDGTVNPDDDCVIEYTIKDAFGNPASSKFYYVIDNARPVVTEITNLPNPKTSHLSACEITGYATDEGSGINTESGVEIKIEDDLGNSTGWI